MCAVCDSRHINYLFSISSVTTIADNSFFKLIDNFDIATQCGESGRAIIFYKF